MRGKDYFEQLLKSEFAFVVDFTTFCNGWLHLRGYRAAFDKARLEQAHADWVTMLSCWTAETVIRSARNKTLDDARRTSFVDDARGEFFESARSSSAIKRAGSLLSCLVDSQPIATIFRHQKLSSGSLSFVGDATPPHLEETVPNEVLESAPSEFLSFLYCWDRFFGVEANRIDRLPLGVAAAPPMTQHYLQNMVTMLYSRAFTPTSLYMVFKSFDLLVMDHTDNLSWGTSR